MKAMLTAVIWIDILACIWIALQFPIIKTTTSNAMEAIKENFIRQELSEAERGDFESLKQRIEGNQTAISNCLTNSRIGAVSIGSILLIQNLVLMSILRTLNQAEQNVAGHPPTRAESQ